VAAGDGRYQIGSSADGLTFVLDTASGRVWRYDRGADAWYLYDLEALVEVQPGGGIHPRRTAPGEPLPSPRESGATGDTTGAAPRPGP
jgi:hypothetical protein